MTPNIELEDLQGWLTPTGEFFWCPGGDHEKWANLQDTTSRELEQKGWIQIVIIPAFPNYLAAMTMCVRPTMLTHSQAEWCSKHNIQFDSQYIRG